MKKVRLLLVRLGSMNMTIKSEVVDCLPALEKFAYLMTGNDEATSEMVGLALRIASEDLHDRHRFPTNLSWLLFVLWSRVLQGGATSLASSLMIDSMISLLQVPPPERAVLILIDGFKLDQATVGLIISEPVDLVFERQKRAHSMFSKLFGCDQT